MSVPFAGIARIRPHAPWLTAPDVLGMQDGREISTGTIAAGAVANVAEKIKGIEFPATRYDVLARALENGADESVLATIRALPTDRAYPDPVQLFDAIGDEVRRLEAAAPRAPAPEAKAGGFRALLDRWRGKR